VARNERIQSLERLLHDAQDNLTQQNHKFEQQLQLVRERLDQARGRMTSPTSGGFSAIAGGLLQGRIAKPLRGGGGNAAAPNGNVNGVKEYLPPLLTLADFRTPLARVQENGTPSKRTSWFFDRR
jgi:kinesin family member 5